MTRKSGFYWVFNYSREWEVAKWDGVKWGACGTDEILDDETFLEIAEQPIVR